MSELGTPVAGNGPGRPSHLNNPETLKKIAQAFSEGTTRENMCQMFGIADVSTITRWRKDPRVKAEVRKIIDERITRISARTDHVLESRLINHENLSVDELIKIRKEFGGSALVRRDVDTDAAMQEAFEALEADPELMDKLVRLLRGESVESPVPDSLPSSVDMSPPEGGLLEPSDEPVLGD